MMLNKTDKHSKILISTFVFLVIMSILLAFWNLFLGDEIKSSRAERERLKINLEKLEILEKTNRNFIKDVVRQKAIALCFLDLIENAEEKYSSKQKEDCIQLIVMADEGYGYRGLDATLILSWLEKESSGNPEAISNAGAKGLTQWLDYQAWTILAAMGYPGYDMELVLDPVINLSGGLYYLKKLLSFWEWKGVENNNAILFYALFSYKWGSECTEELYNTETKASGIKAQYVNWILNRRQYWVGKLKYWMDDAQKLAESVEGEKQ